MHALQGLTAERLCELAPPMMVEEARKVVSAVHKRRHQFEPTPAPLDGACPTNISLSSALLAAGGLESSQVGILIS